MPKIKFIFLFFLGTLILCSYAYSWQKIPLPNQTIQIKEEEMAANGQIINLIRCRSALSQEEIRNFYLRFLPGLGWIADCPECNQQKEDGRLSFSKGDNKIIITIIPAPLEKGKNEIIITMSKLKEEAENPPGYPLEEDISDDTPGTDFSLAPRYPNSQRVSSIERDAGSKGMFAYRSADTTDEIIDFYLKNMGNFNWNLADKIDFGNLPQELSGLQKQFKIEGGALVFKGPAGECIISVTEHPEYNGYRVIGIRYNAK